tara:strand:- start:516 stop:1376 length:861 start_codon:yes stop_codon:yes gene_type:complete
MPLDNIIDFKPQLDALSVPEKIDFEVGFEDTKVEHKKYVVNKTTGEYLDTVGQKFTCANHGDFFRNVQKTLTDELSASKLDGATVKWRDARKNGWAMMDLNLPNSKYTISNNKHTTSISQRIIALHGVDGSCSNQVYFGAIDSFCTNGQITGEWDKVRRKNTSNFSLDRFIDDLKVAGLEFETTARRQQQWLNTPLNAKLEDIQNIVKSDKKAEKMFQLYKQEQSSRGDNVFALYSAFTNYASYADDRNGFSLKNTGNDTQSVSMWQREHEVAKWVSSNEFERLAA